MPFILSKLTTLIGFLLATNGAIGHDKDYAQSLSIQNFFLIECSAVPMSATVLVEPNSSFEEESDVIACDMQGICGLKYAVGQNILSVLAIDQHHTHPFAWQPVYKKWEPLA